MLTSLLFDRIHFLCLVNNIWALYMEFSFLLHCFNRQDHNWCLLRWGIHSVKCGHPWKKVYIWLYKCGHCGNSCTSSCVKQQLVFKKRAARTYLNAGPVQKISPSIAHWNQNTRLEQPQPLFYPMGQTKIRICMIQKTSSLSPPSYDKPSCQGLMQIQTLIYAGNTCSIINLFHYKN